MFREASVRCTQLNRSKTSVRSSNSKFFFIYIYSRGDMAIVSLLNNWSTFLHERKWSSFTVLFIYKQRRGDNRFHLGAIRSINKSIESVSLWNCFEKEKNIMNKSPKFNRKQFKFLLFIVPCGLFLYYYTTSSSVSESTAKARECYLHDGRNPNGRENAITYFEDLLTSVKEPAYDRGIFFIDTTCSDDGIAVMKPR